MFQVVMNEPTYLYSLILICIIYGEYGTPGNPQMGIGGADAAPPDSIERVDRKRNKKGLR